ncbi:MULTISPECIES: hypothetical protein [Paenibacillus]|uniref:hypothetical protein n=1 Tax=Paenibacillus TaxID=44249 RepID=UPI0015758925|nr:hypothetical protein [Paenibacillus sp. JMULE4]NTZ18401.1 hypothetical protein [Paenibacillus sp. JMULE4]
MPNQHDRVFVIAFFFDKTLDQRKMALPINKIVNSHPVLPLVKNLHSFPDLPNVIFFNKKSFGKQQNGQQKSC